MKDKSDSGAVTSARSTPLVLGDPNAAVYPFDPASGRGSEGGQDQSSPRATRAPSAPPAEMRRVEQLQSLGVPDQTPVEFEPVPRESSLLLRNTDDQFADGDEVESTPEPNFWRELLHRPGVSAVLLVLSSCILLFVLSQVLVLINQLSQLPGWIRPFGYAGAALLCGVAVAALVRLFWCYFRLKTTDRISLRALSALRQRARLRSTAIKRIREARNSLVELLEKYPLSEMSEARQLKKLGMTAAEISSLAQCRRRLLADKDGSSEGWMENFNRQFLHLLDEAADRRIRLYAKRSGITTGAAHRGSIDTIIVAMNAYLMVGDLCRIYNVRAGAWGTARILAHIFFNTFAASRVDEWADVAVDHAATAVTQHAEHLEPVAGAVGGVVGGAVGHIPGAVVGAKVASKVASRFVSGGVNAVLLYRLGRATVRQLRPLQERPGTG